MANEEQVKILRQGADVWNNWINKYPNTVIDLSGADLRKANLAGAELEHASLERTHFEEACLVQAVLSGVNLSRAKFIGANLKEAKLINADLAGADFSSAILSFTLLMGASLIGTNLEGAYLKEADFSGANLTETNLKNADFTGVSMSGTMLNALDLSEVFGLESVVHWNPSHISTATIQRSKGKIPEVFLRGCGLSDLDIEYSKLYNPDLTNEEIAKIQYRIYDLRATQAIQISPLFISYSHTDKDFVDQLDSALTKKGVRFWRDIHDAVAGRLETQIDHAIRQNPTVLLILSKNSIKSDWVEHEVRTARQLENELGRDALCPIALDDGWKSSPWPKRVMEQVMEYNILDFSDWEDKSAFEGKFAKLLNGLDLFYKKPKE